MLLLKVVDSIVHFSMIGVITHPTGIGSMCITNGYEALLEVTIYSSLIVFSLLFLTGDTTATTATTITTHKMLLGKMVIRYVVA